MVSCLHSWAVVLLPLIAYALRSNSRVKQKGHTTWPPTVILGCPDRIGERAMSTSANLLPAEATEFLVERWIGLGSNASEFGGFTHAWLTEFLERECELAADHPGVRRSGNEKKSVRFTEALSRGTAEEQCRILQAVLGRFPLDSAPHRDRGGEMQIQAWIGCLDGQTKEAAWYVRIGKRVGRVVLSPLTIGWATLAARILS